MTDAEKCPYDHSLVLCVKCGHYNEGAAFTERMKACLPKWEAYAKRAANDSTIPQKAFEAGFEAGYARANEIFQRYIQLGTVKHE